MAKTKISALTTLADGSIAIGDLIPIVDIDDTSQAASGTTKKVTITSLASAVATAFSGDSPTFVNLNTTGTTTLGDSGDATTVNGTLAVGAITSSGALALGSNTITSGLINSQTISSAANFTGSITNNGNILMNGSGFLVLNANQGGIQPKLLRNATTGGLTITGQGGDGGLEVTGAATITGTLGVTGVSTFSNNVGIVKTGNTGNQLKIIDTDGTTAVIRTYSTADGDGLILNQYFAVSGSPYLRNADFVASMSDISATQMRFFTKAVSSNPAVALTLSSTGAATFSSSVTATSYITSSDMRLKNNIILADLNKCYENIKNLPLKRYTWNDNCLTTEQAKDRNKLGWIAQDVQKVFSKSVFANKFEKVKQEDGFELVEEDVFIETEKEIENKEIKLVGGKYKEVITKEVQKNKEQVFDEFDLFDEAGEIIGRHKVAKKQTVSKPKFKQEVIEDCLSLNADQIYAAMYGAVQLLIQKVEILESK